MKVLIIMGGFFPGKKLGGPPVSIDNFCTLMGDFECYIVTLNHDLFEKQPYADIVNGWNRRGNCNVLYLSDSEYNKKCFERVILELKPGIIYLQGIFQKCVIPSLQLAKKHKVSTIIAPRGELCLGAYQRRAYKKIPYTMFLRKSGLLNNVQFQSTSVEETESIEGILHISTNNIVKLDNIPSIPATRYEREEKVTGKANFVFLSRIHPKKNLLEAIRYMSSVKGSVIFDIYGPIENNEYWNKCKDVIAELPTNIKIQYRGLVDHEEVHKVFSLYDAFVFPTLSENYGHVIVEALIVGTQVIISDQTPWTDVNGTGAGWAISLTKKEKFVEAIQYVVDEMDNSYVGWAKTYITKKLKIDNLKNQYSEAFQLFLNSNKM